MKITLDFTKTLEQNAEVYFEKSKKTKKKLEGAVEALEISKKKLEVIKKRQEKEIEAAEKKEKKAKRKEQWFEKFRWFISSEGFLVVGGRDATSNEILIKKHTEKDDIVFHTDMAGSPFFIVKKNSAKGKEVSEITLQEAADATCSYSRAWKLGMTTTDVFHVKPKQVTKKAQTGEYLQKGSFMIKGKTNYVHSKISLAIGITKKGVLEGAAAEEGIIMGGPVSAVRNNCSKFIELSQGKEKSSAIAKKIKAKIGGDLDDIIRAIPAGGAKIIKIRAIA